jgi:Protein of unknown function (DUF4242)
MSRVLVEYVFDEPLTEEFLARMAKRIDPCLDARAAIWRRSYVSIDKKRMSCEFEAPDAEVVREALRAAEVKFERAWAADVFAVEDYPELLAKLDQLKK